MIKKTDKFRNNKDTRDKAKRRRAVLYDFWIRGTMPGEVSKMQFSIPGGDYHDWTENEGSGNGTIPLSTIKADWKHFEKDAAEDYDISHKRGKAVAMICRTISQADKLYETAPDVKDKATALSVKVKAIEQYSKIHGLLIETKKSIGDPNNPIVHEHRLGEGMTEEEVINIAQAVIDKG